MTARAKASGVAKPQTKPIPLELPTELRLDLQVFCRQHFDAPMSSVIRRALQIFLDEQQRSDQQFDRALNIDRQTRLSVVRDNTDKFAPKD
jgi:hypothetical protein